jgi:hypothetical protein
MRHVQPHLHKTTSFKQPAPVKKHKKTQPGFARYQLRIQVASSTSAWQVKLNLDVN